MYNSSARNFSRSPPDQYLPRELGVGRVQYAPTRVFDISGHKKKSMMILRLVPLQKYFRSARQHPCVLTRDERKREKSMKTVEIVERGRIFKKYSDAQVLRNGGHVIADGKG